MSPEEVELLSSFREMHTEDRAILLDYARSRAIAERVRIVGNSLPSSAAALCNTPS